ncbi:MAG: slipin family protein [Chloroflexi bacterium]|nr:slipin family protein [Chloroflexota bacterium]
MRDNEFIIKNTHRGLWYQDGVLTQILEAGRYQLPRRRLFRRKPEVEILLVDMRERDLTIKNQEILTADKVAIRVSIIVRFRVTDPQAVIQEVEDFETRIYSDVQLAARRSLASMTLEQIMTNRNQLSEDILADVTESAASYGVSIRRADVKDLIFPGNLQDIMNRVLSAERMAEARLIEARAKAEVERIEAQTEADARRISSAADAEATRQAATAEVEAERIRTEAEIRDLRARAEVAGAYTEHPALLRQLELEALRDLSRLASARIYINFGSNGDGRGGAASNGSNGFSVGSDD